VIGVAIPAHDEAATLGACLRSVLRAAAHPRLRGERVLVVLVLDDCTDASAGIGARFPVTTLPIRARNVGRARALGVQHLVRRGARWIACTDADSVVAPDWLADQLALDHDVVCGAVAVDWRGQAAWLRRAYEARYVDADGHRHVHGANLGFRTHAYRRSGGFAALRAHEDVALVQALERRGAAIAWSARPRVTTSARLAPRARGGFGDYLAALARALPPPSP
jgi:glycosyltransferase involved in cell wall biosynthesis